MGGPAVLCGFSMAGPLSACGNTAMRGHGLAKPEVETA